jgi:hypothetical protein
MIGLNLLLWLLQTINNALALYQAWLAFIRDAGDLEPSVLILNGTIGPSVAIANIRYYLSAMLPAIADTVMVSIA